MIMERKIGEIFEYNGEWYQAIDNTHGVMCSGCTFVNEYNDCEADISVVGNCGCEEDNPLIFKKLEKVGEPYDFQKRTFQTYKLHTIPFLSEDVELVAIPSKDNNTIEIEIKQTKEDMEERELDPRMAKVIDEATQKMGEEIGRQIEANINKQRMKPFNLEAAKAGKPVCTRDGHKARIICFDLNNDEYPIVVAITNNGEENEIHKYSIDGKICTICTIKEDDLMMLPEKKEGWIIVSKNATIYDSLDDAKKSFDSDKELCICKVEWEE